MSLVVRLLLFIITVRTQDRLVRHLPSNALHVRGQDELHHSRDSNVDF